MAIESPNIPTLSSKVDTEVKRAFTSIRGWVDTIRARGGVLTNSTLADALAAIGAFSPFLNTTVPPALANFVATGAFAKIMLTWDDPRYAAFSYVEVWRATVDDIGQAVKIGTTLTTMYSDDPPNASLSVTYYYWARIISTANIVGPFNATAGTGASTANDPTYMLEILSQQLGSSQLNLELNQKIAQIDTMATNSYVDGKILGITQAFDPTGLAGMQDVVSESAMWNMLTTANIASANLQYRTNADAISAEADLRVALSATVANNFSLFRAEQVARSDADSANAMSIMALSATVATAQADIATEQNTRATADSANADNILALAATVNSNAASILSEQTIRATADSANADNILALAATVNSNAASILSEQTARASGDSANASRITTLQTTVNGNTNSIQTQQTSINGILGQYTIKIDTNGRVAGIGLMNNGATSSFQIVADEFSIAPVATDPTASSNSPFFHLSVPTVVNGVTLPAGTYIKTAFIADLTANNIRVGGVTADRLTVSNLAAISANLGNITAGTMNIGAGRFQVAADGSVLIQSATTGARLVMANNFIKVYDSNNILRVQMGDLSA